jgi:hypothetical protein
MHKEDFSQKDLTHIDTITNLTELTCIVIKPNKLIYESPWLAFFPFQSRCNHDNVKESSDICI